MIPGDRYLSSLELCIHMVLNRCLWNDLQVSGFQFTIANPIPRELGWLHWHGPGTCQKAEHQPGQPWAWGTSPSHREQGVGAREDGIGLEDRRLGNGGACRRQEE